MPKPWDEYDYVLDILKSGKESQLVELEQLIDDFPNGNDDYIGRRWIINAIDCGSKASVDWMLSREVDLIFEDNEGFTVLHSAIDRSLPDKYPIIESLLKHGASINAHGFNDWTPTHMAIARNDLESLKLLIRFGADMSIRTRIDHYETPLELAKRNRNSDAIQLLEKSA